MFVIEHIEQELFEWSICEYKSVCELGVNLMISNVKNKQEFIDKVHPETPSIQYIHESVLEVCDRNSTCVLDMRAEQTLSIDDQFSHIIIGGVLGDVPPRDRAAHLRTDFVQLRNLGTYQMPTSTAAHVAKMILIDKVPFDAIPIIKDPEFELPGQEYQETVEMNGFAYVADEQGKPIIPDGMLQLFFKDLVEDDL